MIYLYLCRAILLTHEICGRNLQLQRVKNCVEFSFCLFNLDYVRSSTTHYVLFGSRTCTVINGVVQGYLRGDRSNSRSIICKNSLGTIFRQLQYSRAPSGSRVVLCNSVVLHRVRQGGPPRARQLPFSQCSSTLYSKIQKHPFLAL